MSYDGPANTTIGGLTCQAWSVQHPHGHEFSHVGDHNYCRDPDGLGKVWCFTTDPDKRWDRCPVPICPEETIERAVVEGVGCQEAATYGADYRGTADTTRRGLTCQAWSVQEPHGHNLFQNAKILGGK